MLAAEAAAAVEYFKDLTEWESLTLARTRHNPLPFFARLKAERPARYIERSIALTIDAGGGDSAGQCKRHPPPDARPGDALNPPGDHRGRRGGVNDHPDDRDRIRQGADE